MKYEWIDGDALGILDPILTKMGWSGLNGKTCRAYVAFDDTDRIVGFQVFQLHPVVGPMYVDPTHRGLGLPEEMSAEMVKFTEEIECRGFLVVADHPVSQRICEAQGMVKVTSPVYIKT